jgi:hypothetical protein
MAEGANVARFYFHLMRLTELIEDERGIEVASSIMRDRGPSIPYGTCSRR